MSSKLTAYLTLVLFLVLSLSSGASAQAVYGGGSYESSSYGSPAQDSTQTNNRDSGIITESNAVDFWPYVSVFFVTIISLLGIIWFVKKRRNSI